MEVRLDDEAATADLGADLAMAMDRGWLILLEGDLGAGKTTLARGFIRALCGVGTEVPSPTFTIVQAYDCEGGPVGEILHADLYRIADPAEIAELGLQEADPGRAMLVEWPEKGGDTLPRADLTIHLGDNGETGRLAILEADGDVLERIGRSLDIRRFIDAGWGRHAERHRLAGDASSRAYETIALFGQERILMNSPRRPDGPPIRDGLPYSRIAHLAEDVRAFAGMRDILAGAGLAVPDIHAADYDRGLLLISDLGRQGIIDAVRRPIAERYLAAAEMLAQFHRVPAAHSARLADGSVHAIPAYDRGAMMIEAELLLDWYAPRFKGGALSPAEKAGFTAIWDELIGRLEGAEKHVVLRDFHSPNILWQPGETGARRIGLIDFQDAVLGPSAYDLASLAQDARVDVPAILEQRIVDHYIGCRRAGDGIDEASFRESYAIMAAQRATKILGIFVRLDERDGKPAYLAHLPRLQDYLDRSFAHPVLSRYRDWFNSVMRM